MIFWYLPITLIHKYNSYYYRKSNFFINVTIFYFYHTNNHAGCTGASPSTTVTDSAFCSSDFACYYLVTAGCYSVFGAYYSFFSYGAFGSTLSLCPLVYYVFFLSFSFIFFLEFELLPVAGYFPAGYFPAGFPFVPAVVAGGCLSLSFLWSTAGFPWPFSVVGLSFSCPFGGFTFFYLLLSWALSGFPAFFYWEVDFYFYLF